MHVQHLEECPDIGPGCALTPLAPYQHDQHLYSNDLVLDAELGLAEHLGLELIAGLRQTTDRIQFLDLAGNPYLPPVPDDHHRNETLFGPTDPWLMLHGGTSLAGFVLSGRVGLTLPLGSTVPNPFALGRLGLPHEHIQFGDGTWDPILGASIDRRVGPVSLGLWTLDRLTFGTNDHGYRSGHRLIAGAVATSRLGFERLTFSAGFDVSRETPERWGGVIEDEGKLGRTDLLADLTAGWDFARGWTATLGLKLPLVSFVRGEQASYPGILTLAIATDFRLGR